MTWLKRVLMESLISLVVGGIVVCALGFGLKWTWLYSFMVPGMFYFLLAFHDISRNKPLHGFSAPGVSYDAAQKNLQEISLKVEGGQDEKQIGVFTDIVFDKKSLYHMIIKRSYMSYIIYSLAFFVAGYWIYFRSIDNFLNHEPHDILYQKVLFSLCRNFFV